ncbi:MAG: hypothetical protein B7Z08_04230 [Sphingomonadales bacterium 32-68-7]|nr:MAG: hypothetical protein B7Z33_13585 [Sphingomonadales bacterium 12-68-11]OYX09736.1 MAG: hypothetical protein B7Z08_04230 [Sphingomonadales bacterium 32-68-7]
MFQGQPLPPCVLQDAKPVGAASCYTREPGQLVVWHAVAPGVFVRICRSERGAASETARPA